MAEADVTEGRKPRLLAKTRMRYDPVRQKHVLLLPERAVLLNTTAAETLELCDGSRTVSGVIEALRHKYLGADLQADVVELLHEADARGWIEWLPE